MLARLALLTQTIIAAGTFLVAKDATERFHPFHLVWFRIVLSALIMAAVFAVRFRRLPRFPRGDAVRLALLAIMGVTINQGLFLYGLERTTPLHAALLYAFTPVLVLTAAVLWQGEVFTWRRLGGVGLAVTGVVLVLLARGLDLATGPLLGDLFILIAVFAWAGFTVLGKDLLRRIGTLEAITLCFLAGGVSVLPATPWIFRYFDPRAPGLVGWLEVLYLGAVTSALAFSLWYYALRRMEASQVAVFTNLQPPLTAVLAWIAFGDVPAPLGVLGGAAVLAGVTLAQLPGRRSGGKENALRVAAKGAAAEGVSDRG